MELRDIRKQFYLANRIVGQVAVQLLFERPLPLRNPNFQLKHVFCACCGVGNVREREHPLVMVTIFRTNRHELRIGIEVEVANRKSEPGLHDRGYVTVRVPGIELRRLFPGKLGLEASGHLLVSFQSGDLSQVLLKWLQAEFVDGLRVEERVVEVRNALRV